MMIKPRYPIYIPSKGRYDNPLTAKCFIKDNVDFHLVIEDHEYDKYAANIPEKYLLVLPFANQGSVIPARNWIKEHAIAAGYERHWQFDDNIEYFRRNHKLRIECHSVPAICSIEDFTDRYINLAISGFNYTMFTNPGAYSSPFRLNVRVYSATLILNSIPFQWRGKYNEDIDLCLQALSKGWCTVLVNVFAVHKKATMIMRGGNTDELYQGDGRLKMAKSLEARWPDIVQTKTRWGRPQHVVDFSGFTQRLKLKKGIRLEDFEPNEYGLKLRQVADKIKHPEVQKLLDDYNQPAPDDGDCVG
jgi:hypothetical protein